MKKLFLLLFVLAGTTASAQQDRVIWPRENFACLNGNCFADAFPGATVTEQIANCLADAAPQNGTCIVPAKLGAGAIPSVPTGSTLIDLRNGQMCVTGRFGTHCIPSETVVLDGAQCSGDGLRAAIASFGSGPGGAILIPQPCDLGDQTIELGTFRSGNQGDDSTVITLIFLSEGEWTVGGCPGIQIRNRSSIVGLSERSTVIRQTNPLCDVIEIGDGNNTEGVKIHEIRLRDGNRSIRGRSSTPQLSIRRVTSWNAAANAIELQSANDMSVIDGFHAVSPGGSCIRGGVYTGDVSQEIGINQFTLRNLRCINAGEKGFWWEPTAFQSTNSFGVVTMENLEFLTIQEEAIVLRGLGSVGGIRLAGFTANNACAAGGATCDVIVANNGGFAGLFTRFEIAGAVSASGQARHGLNLNCGGGCLVDRATFSNTTAASMLLTGDVALVRSGGTIDAASNFFSNFFSRGETRFRNDRDAEMLIKIISGLTGTQNSSLVFSDRDSDHWLLRKDGANDFILRQVGSTDVFKANRTGTNNGNLELFRGLQVQTLAFAGLPAAPNGTIYYCSDCTVANPCASGGTGALAKRINGAWVCN